MDWTNASINSSYAKTLHMGFPTKCIPNAWKTVIGYHNCDKAFIHNQRYIFKNSILDMNYGF